MSLEGLGNAIREKRAAAAPAAVQKQIDSTFTKEELDRLGSAIEVVKAAAITEFISGQSGPSETVAGLAQRFRSNPQQFAVDLLKKTAGGYGAVTAQNVSNPTSFRDSVTQAVDFAKRTGLSQESIVSTANDAYSKVYSQNVPTPNSSFGDFLKQAVGMVAPFVIPGIGAEIGASLLPAASAGTQAVVGSALVGGTVAEVTGGKFVEGAIKNAAIAAASAQTAQAASDAKIGDTTVNADYTLRSPTGPVVDGMGAQGIDPNTAGLGIKAPASGVIGDPTSFINQVAPNASINPSFSAGDVTARTDPTAGEIAQKSVEQGVANTVVGTIVEKQSFQSYVDQINAEEALSDKLAQDEMARLQAEADARLRADQDEFTRAQSELDAMFQQERDEIARQAAEYAAAQQRMQEQADAERARAEAEQRALAEERARTEAEAAAAAERNRRDIEGMQREGAEREVARRRATRTTVSRPLLAGIAGDKGPQTLGYGGQIGRGGSMGGSQTLGVG